MRESEGTAPCIIFRERRQSPTGRASRNRKHCKLKGKGPVRGFTVNTSVDFDFAKSTSRLAMHKWHMSLFTSTAPPSSSPHSMLSFFFLFFKLLYRHQVLVVCDDVGMWLPFSKPLTFRWAFFRMCVHPSCVCCWALDLKITLQQLSSFWLWIIVFAFFMPQTLLPTLCLVAAHVLHSAVEWFAELCCSPTLRGAWWEIMTQILYQGQAL